MKKISLNTLIIALLAILSGTLLFKYLPARNNQTYSYQINEARNRIYSLSNTKIPQNLNLMPNKSGLDSNLTSQLQKSEYSLIILFEPTQCGACLDEKVLWNEIDKSGIIPVYAVTYLKDKQELNKYLTDSKTEIPVYQDTLASIGKYLLPQGVPVKLLVNKKHEIIFADYVRKTEAEREQFIKMINYYKNNF
jgi:hypothetical protein